MKTLFFTLALSFCTVIIHAQEIVQLEETEVKFTPLSSMVAGPNNSFSFIIKETYTGEFESNPLAFMQQHFDIKDFMQEVDDNRIDSYQVNFKTQKGELKVAFNKDGKLVRSMEKFKNIKMPNALCHQIYRDHKGWNIVENLHIALGRNGTIHKDFYKLKMENGNDKKRVKIDWNAARSLELANN